MNQIYDKVKQLVENNDMIFVEFSCKWVDDKMSIILQFKFDYIKKIQIVKGEGNTEKEAYSNFIQHYRL